MRLNARARVGLFVSLGILAGIGFVGLPGFLVGSPQTILAPRSNGSNSTSSSGTVTSMGATPTFNTRSNMSKTQQIPAGDQQVSPGSLAALVSLVIVPAMAISLVGSVFVARRTRRPSSKILSDQV